MPMYKLTESSYAYSTISGSLRQYYRDEPALNNNGEIIDFPNNNNNNNNNNSVSFKFKPQITGQTGNSGTKDVEIMIPLKYLSNFRRTLEMLLINCETSSQLEWSNNVL